MRRYTYNILLAILITLPLSQFAGAGTISPDLQSVVDSAVPSQKVDVIIILKDRVNLSTFTDPDIRERRKSILTALKDKANRTQTPVLDFLIARNAGTVNSLWIINGISATVRAAAIPLLARLPAVDEVRLNIAIPLAEPPPGESSPIEWNLDAINASTLWALGYTGQGIVIAGMDTGVDNAHNDLSGRWRGGANSWYDPNGVYTDPYDFHGHGTRTMGLMVGGDATGSSIGVAPGAEWIAVKIFNNAGEAPLDSIHMGFQWLLDPDGNVNTDDAPDVVNNSWGFRNWVDICYLEFQPDIQALQAAGIGVVFSAGNEGPGPATSISPANNPESFAVGAVDINQNLASFSSQGPSPCVIENDFFPEVVAPGVGLKTSDRTFGFLLDSSAYVSGTSFAAPMTAGAIALLMEAFPSATYAELEEALKNTAHDLGDPGPDNEYGYGQIDVLAAYRSLVPCTDDDNDGFYLEAVCDVEPDCDDGDNAIYPSAPEIKGDGIDQDCNGHDLTINILGAQYLNTSDTLCVVATSAHNGGAELMLAPDTPMTWHGGAIQKWSVIAETVGGDPGQVEVTGTEGSEFSATTVVSSAPCWGDFDWSGGVETADLIVFAAGFGSASGYDGSHLADLATSYGRDDCPMCY